MLERFDHNRAADYEKLAYALRLDLRIPPEYPEELGQNLVIAHVFYRCNNRERPAQVGEFRQQEHVLATGFLKFVFPSLDVGFSFFGSGFVPSKGREQAMGNRRAHW